MRGQCAGSAASFRLLFPPGFWLAVWVLWAFLARGGVSYRLVGLMPVRADGARAGRLRLAWRALLVWAPIATLLALAVMAEYYYPVIAELTQAVFALAWGWLVVLAISGLRESSRALHDRLSGVTLVPR